MKQKVYFNNVGQGLFAEVYLGDDSGSEFRIVYDCGTSNRQQVVQDAISASTHRAKNRPIDLLVISHFDRDHISGVIDLIRAQQVRAIMLPKFSYILRVAFASLKDNSERLNSDVREVLENPVSKLSKIHQQRHDTESPRFILVGAEEGYEFPFNNSDNSILRELDVVTIPSGKPERVDIKPQAAETEVFEIIPYVDDRVVLNKLKTFELKAGQEVSKLLGNGDKLEKQHALNNLKDLYTQTFGGSAYRKNVISLFLCIGPLRNQRNTSTLTYSYRDKKQETVVSDIQQRSNILFTGDGFLNTLTRWNALVSEMTQARLDKVAIFQVMHHGSKGSWYRGLASCVNPLASVFSSDPNLRNTRHPSESVIKDFIYFNPIQVDQEHSCELTLEV
ncbi:MBL fold metallo-hydrolase [Idiomarina sp. HP20-50]|uniref:MBL fold metallo-hydrolase n=1 Tax=Idiomarina sp. HP20-50 TaxID=3070813 RepID=UPI00294AB119|nr:MBL fold metallo-hydrolase [Idiomarina sp. HP20-50]MDV6315724.1 MBL fold metallo-hydrolase [Idiomarina sp. HP20-50]